MVYTWQSDNQLTDDKQKVDECIIGEQTDLYSDVSFL
jgi:hypothetical protein